MKFLHLILWIYSSFVYFCSSNFVDISSEVFNENVNAIIASFGDYNSDKLTDVFIISPNGVDILIPREDKINGEFKFNQKTIIPQKSFTNGTIQNVVPGDFDGDLRVDVLIVTEQKNVPSQVVAEIFWGDGTESFKRKGNVVHLVDQPLVMDFDGDLIPDLFGEVEPGKRFYWTAKDRNYTAVPINSTTNSSFPPLRKPHSNSFLDLNGDFAADLFITTNKGFEVWENEGGILTFNYDKNIKLPPDASTVGQSSFLDIDGDGIIDQILPVIGLDHSSQIYLYNNNKWESLPIEFIHDGKTWGFRLPEKSTTFLVPVQLHIGDYNQDGYPDAMTILHTTHDQKDDYQVVLLQNIPCSGVSCPAVGRTFKIIWNIASNMTNQPVLTAFYDIGEDGVLDILVVAKTADGYKINALKNYPDAGDACFLKTLVLSGLCNVDPCPYGVLSPGATVCFNTTVPDGSPLKGCGAQLSQSAHFALQLPFTAFGLGQTPNFIDHLTVGIPYPKGKSIRSHEWTFVIPNSQLVVIPYPADSSTKWKNKLFVTPSRLVLITGAAMLGTCGFIAGIVGILHWKEKREDKMEKRQDAHKFHFDAM